MVMKRAFEIEDMRCAYAGSGEKVVLHIRHLVIHKGETVFFVGPSGIGKSTILEAMGMMNRTVLPGCGRFEYMGMDMRDWWQLGDRQQSEFRSREFSFIFQSNNLMNNFTAWENVKSTALFQGMTEDEAESIKEQVFTSIDITNPEKWDAPVTNLSGGQRQRLAFARAVMPRFNVLFGDEPTGNLDPQTARTLMGRLRDILKRKGDATAIIVSHDMDLATSYADRIVRFHKVERGYSGPVGIEADTYGYIDAGSFYLRIGEDEWREEATGTVCSRQGLCDKLRDHMTDIRKEDEL